MATEPGKPQERLLVCVSASPASAGLIRAAERRAAELSAPWLAVHAERGPLVVTAEDRERAARHLRLAQTLGAETMTLPGADPAGEILDFATRRHVTRILVGRPTHPPWRDWIGGSFLHELGRRAAGHRIEIVGDAEGLVTETRDLPTRGGASTAAWVVAGAVPVLTTLVSIILGRAELADVVMVYLAGVVFVAMRWPVLPSLFTAGVSVLAFDFFFVPPLHDFGFADPRHAVTTIVMFVVAGVISVLAERSRGQAEAARRREARTSALYALTRALAGAKTEPEILEVARAHLTESFGAPVEIDLDGPTSDRADVLRVALHGSSGDIGALTLRRHKRAADDDDAQVMLHAFAVPIAAALDRARISEVARVARLRAETEQMRNALLSSVSHDLRTPLAVITGAATTLLDGKVEDATRRELTEEIVVEAERLHRLVRNLLDMTRLEAGAIELKKDWQPLEEVVGSATDRLTRVLEGRQLDISLDADVGLVPFDPVLLEQVLVNLLENAGRYTPKDAPIAITASRRDHGVEVVVSDRGPGVPPGDEERIFERFQRASKVTGGTGLGLTICRGIIALHGGRIWAENVAGGGAAIHFTLPIEGEPPPLSAPFADPQAAIEELSA